MSLGKKYVQCLLLCATGCFNRRFGIGPRLDQCCHNLIMEKIKDKSPFNFIGYGFLMWVFVNMWDE